MILNQVMEILEDVAPTHLAESWDNVGLLIGDPAAEVSRILLTIDYSPAVAHEAQRYRADLVIAYHPPIFKPFKRFTAENPLFEPMRRGVAFYSLHTALDSVVCGTNDMLADILGLEQRRALKAALLLQTPTPNANPGCTGIGRIGDVPAIDRVDLIQRIKRSLKVKHVQLSGPSSGSVTKAAVCAGSCGDLMRAALVEGAQFYLTGELRHHDALEAAAKGMTVVCVGHSNSERAILTKVAGILESRCSDVAVQVSAEDRDPFVIL